MIFILFAVTPFTVRPTALTTVGTKSTETATHPPVKTTTSTTHARDGPRASTTDARGPSGLTSHTGAHGSSGLTNSEKGGIIGGCIVFGFVIAIIAIFICYIYKKRKNSSGK